MHQAKIRKILSYYFSLCGLQGSIFCDNQDVWNGSVYHNNSAPQYATALETLKEVTFNISNKILDIGCGSGDINANILASLVPQGHVHGIDMSNSMIAFAQKTYKDIPNISFDVVDVRDWAPDNKKYDCVVSFNAFHWIEDLQRVFVGVAQRLKPGGIFLFAMGHKKNFYENSVLSVTSSPKWKNYLKNPTQLMSFTQDKESIEKILDYAEFAPLVIRTWNQKVHLESKEKFALFTRAWIYVIPHLQGLSENIREAIIDDIIEHSPIKTNKDGSIDYLTPILIVKAVKKTNN